MHWKCLRLLMTFWTFLDNQSLCCLTIFRNAVSYSWYVKYNRFLFHRSTVNSWIFLSSSSYKMNIIKNVKFKQLLLHKHHFALFENVFGRQPRPHCQVWSIGQIHLACILCLTLFMIHAMRHHPKISLLTSWILVIFVIFGTFSNQTSKAPY